MIRRLKLQTSIPSLRQHGGVSPTTRKDRDWCGLHYRQVYPPSHGMSTDICIARSDAMEVLNLVASMTGVVKSPTHSWNKILDGNGQRPRARNNPSTFIFFVSARSVWCERTNQPSIASSLETKQYVKPSHLFMSIVHSFGSNTATSPQSVTITQNAEKSKR